MRYAVTFTSDPNAYDWGDTDTIIVEVDDKYTGEDNRAWWADNTKLIEIVRKYREYDEGIDIDPNYIYLRNVDDIDITINEKGELQ